MVHIKGCIVLVDVRCFVDMFRVLRLILLGEECFMDMCFEELIVFVGGVDFFE